MSVSTTRPVGAGPRPAGRIPGLLATPGFRRASLAGVVLAAAVAGWVATPQSAAVRSAQGAGADLARLLKMMAVLKAVIAVGALWLVDWRLQLPTGPRMFAAYAATSALLAAGPGLIWNLDHIIAGALVFHAGLAMLVLLAWADDGSGAALQTALERMRARRRQ